MQCPYCSKGLQCIYPSCPYKKCKKCGMKMMQHKQCKHCSDCQHCPSIIVKGKNNELFKIDSCNCNNAKCKLSK